jgi:predicted signal transduction protein with EAL and GGDEF domain
MSAECLTCGRNLTPFADNCDYCLLRETNDILKGENAILRAGIERLVGQITEATEALERWEERMSGMHSEACYYDVGDQAGVIQHQTNQICAACYVRRALGRLRASAKPDGAIN